MSVLRNLLQRCDILTTWYYSAVFSKLIFATVSVYHRWHQAVWWFYTNISWLSCECQLCQRQHSDLLQTYTCLVLCFFVTRSEKSPQGEEKKNAFTACSSWLRLILFSQSRILVCHSVTVTSLRPSTVEQWFNVSSNRDLKIVVKCFFVC